MYTDSPTEKDGMAFPTKKGSALPVRLTEDEKDLLSDIAADTGLTVSTLVRILVESFVRNYRRNGNRFTLPISWREMTEAGI